MDFDLVLSDVGSFGLYQKYIIGILLPAVLPCAFHAYSQLFIASRQAHWCRVPELEPWVNIYPDVVKNLSIPLEYRDGKYQYSNCKMYIRNYTDVIRILATKTPIDLNNYAFMNNELENQNQNNEILLMAQSLSMQPFETEDCTTGWNFDRRIFPNTVVMEWNLVCTKDFYPTIALVLFGVGGLIGNYVFGYLQDYWGRKPSFYVYLLLEISACVLSTFSWNFLSWLICRIIVGLTVPAILASPYVLAIELVGPDHRVLCTIVLNIAYSIGLVLLSGVVYLVRDWRYLSLAVSIPLLLLFSCFFVLPESPRWLIATGNFKRAAKVMKTIAKFNGKNIPDDYERVLREKLLVPQKSTKLVRTLLQDGEIGIESFVLIDSSSSQPPPALHQQSLSPAVPPTSIGMLDLFRTPNMRAKTLIITFIWFSNTCVYVGLSYYAPALGGDEIWNFFLAGAVELPTYIFLWPGLHFFGRRWILCASMIIGGVACLATFLVQQDKTIMLALYCVGKMGISSAFVVLPLAASELYPTVVRGLGMSFSSVIGMIGPIVIPIINHTGSNMLVLPIIIMGSLLTLGGLASLFLPETMGKSLPQTIQDGENIRLSNPFKFRCGGGLKGTNGGDNTVGDNLRRQRIRNIQRKSKKSLCSNCKTEIKDLNK